MRTTISNRNVDCRGGPHRAVGEEDRPLRCRGWIGCGERLLRRLDGAPAVATTPLDVGGWIAGNFHLRLRRRRETINVEPRAPEEAGGVEVGVGVECLCAITHGEGAGVGWGAREEACGHGDTEEERDPGRHRSLWLAGQARGEAAHRSVALANCGEDPALFERWRDAMEERCKGDATRANREERMDPRSSGERVSQELPGAEDAELQRPFARALQEGAECVEATPEERADAEGKRPEPRTARPRGRASFA